MLCWSSREQVFVHSLQTRHSPSQLAAGGTLLRDGCFPLGPGNLIHNITISTLFILPSYFIQAVNLIHITPLTLFHNTVQLYFIHINILTLYLFYINFPVFILPYSSYSLL